MCPYSTHLELETTAWQMRVQLGIWLAATLAADASPKEAPALASLHEKCQPRRGNSVQDVGSTERSGARGRSSGRLHKRRPPLALRLGTTIPHDHTSTERNGRISFSAWTPREFIKRARVLRNAARERLGILLAYRLSREMLSILRKARLKDKELRILML